MTRVTSRSKSAAVTLSIRTRRPSTSRANRLSSPSGARTSTGGVLVIGVAQDFEVGLRLPAGREGGTGGAEARDVGHRSAQGREVGDGTQLGGPEIGGE